MLLQLIKKRAYVIIEWPLRCVTMLITSLSVPGTHLECQPRPYGDLWNKVHNAYIIWTGIDILYNK